MTFRNRKNIQVSPSTLNNLIVGVEQGTYRIPQFQREYVWEKSKVISLFDSIYREYPIGSFFIWKAGREHNRLFRHSIDLNIRPIKEDDDISFILDGQQRITSLYVTLMGLTARHTDYSRMCFDVKDEKFTYREPDNRRFIGVRDIWGENALKVARGIDDIHKDKFDRCWGILRTYPISIVEVGDQDLASVCNIFQRINQGGKRLDRFDLVSSMTFTTDFDLREAFKQDIVAKLKAKMFGGISPAIVTQLMALVKKGACTERVEYSLTSAEIREMWRLVVDSILLAADTLRTSVGVQNAQYLPYDALLTLLSYFFAKSKQRSPSEDQLCWIKRWFWRASFSQHYGSGGATKIGRDKERFDHLIAGDLPAFDPAINLSAENLVGTKMTWSRSAIRNAFLCLLAHRDPVHLVNNNRLDLTNGGISDFTSAEKHHIFPQAFLGRSNYGEEQVHALPNFCFMPAELNRRILDARPSDYFAQLRMQNGQFAEAAHTHLIPINDDSGLANNEYLTFLKVRSGLILAEIEQLMGLSATPRADQRQEAIERVETQLRNLIHNTLSDAHGPDYWRTAIPEDVRIEAEKRIASTLHKQPGLSAQKFTNAREKLSFCNIPDYLKLILIRNNWPHFEPVIRRKVDVERHLEAFSEFRNALMHGRPVTEFTRKAGELAMIWLELVISAQNEESSDAEQEDDAPDVSARVEPKKSKDVSAAKPVGVEEKMDGI